MFLLPDLAVELSTMSRLVGTAGADRMLFSGKVWTDNHWCSTGSFRSGCAHDIAGAGLYRRPVPKSRVAVLELARDGQTAGPAPT